MIIAIDGPSGAGKSTLGKMIAKEYELLYLDTGAMYRAVALAVITAGIEVDEQTLVVQTAVRAEIQLVGEPDEQRVFLDGRDVSEEIREPEVGQRASVVSTISGVRRNLVDRQQKLGRESANGAVLDGRDIGTVVFPDADVKFFLTAKPEARARRRFDEDKAKGRDVSYEETANEISKRDQRDASRRDSPLRIAEDAVVIDTSELGLEEVFEAMRVAIERVKSEE